VISIEGLAMPPRPIQDLYDKIKSPENDGLLWETLRESVLFSESLTETFCHTEDGDFLIVYGKNAYHFSHAEDKTWKISMVGRPEVLIEDEQIRDTLEESIPDVSWVLINTNLNDDESNSWTPFQAHFFDRINIVIDTAYANLK